MQQNLGMRRALVVVIVAVLVAGGVALAVGVTSTRTHRTATTSTASSTHGSAQVSVTVTVVLAGRSALVIDATGAYDWAARTGRFAETSTAAGRPPVSGTIVVSAGRVFARVAGLPGSGGRPWFTLPTSAVAGLAGGASPGDIARALRDPAAPATKVGEQVIGDTPTTHYRLEVSPRRSGSNPAARGFFAALPSAAGAQQVPLGIWLAADGLARQTGLLISLDHAYGGGASAPPELIIANIGLSGYGTAVSASAPARSQVSATPLPKLTEELLAGSTQG